MRIYADTSVLIAWFQPADEFAQAVFGGKGRHYIVLPYNILFCDGHATH